MRVDPSARISLVAATKCNVAGGIAALAAQRFAWRSVRDDK